MRIIDADQYAVEMKRRQDAVSASIEHSIADRYYTDKEHWEGVMLAFVEAKLTLDKMSTVDAAPVKHGRWMEYKYDEKHYKTVIVPYDGKGIPNNIFCSECRKPSLCNGHEEDVASDFCPHCGAKMDLEGLDDRRDQQGNAEK